MDTTTTRRAWLGVLACAALLVGCGGSGSSADPDAAADVPVCGDGEVDPGEQCDDGNTAPEDGCSDVCALEYCGNGVIDPGEICDDGNNTGGDGCARACDSDETCGNGTVDLAAGEQCDDGNTAPEDGCSDVCALEYCGNGVIDPGEICDDGNNTGGDGCAGACDSDETCGNGIVDLAAGEQCDDGNTAPEDGCSESCVFDYLRVRIPVKEVNGNRWRGWWQDDGSHDSANDTTVTGRLGGLGEYNSYFVFDLSSLAGATVVGAYLLLELEAYRSGDPSETVAVWDVSTAPATLEASGSSVAIHDDLETGTSYGAITFGSGDVGGVKERGLGAQGIADVNAALGGDFAVGLSLDTLNASGDEYLGFGHDDDAQARQHLLELRYVP